MYKKFGLSNKDNTCYMNSVLQCLKHIKPLTDYFLSSSGYNFDNKNFFPIISEYIKLLKDLNGMNGENYSNPIRSFSRFNNDSNYEINQYSGNYKFINYFNNEHINNGYNTSYQNDYDYKKNFNDYNSYNHYPNNYYNIKNNNNNFNKNYCSKDGLKCAISKEYPLYNTYMMNDCAEFLSILLSLLNKDFQSNDNIIQNLFQIKIETQSGCEECNKRYGEKEIDEEFSYYLNLPIVSKEKKEKLKSLEDCIKEYLKKKYFEDEICPRCRTKLQFEKIKNIKNPKVLVFNLKRIVKGQHYTHEIFFQKDIIFNNEKYKLINLIIHIGSQFSGHKIAICKDEYNNWFLFDDEKNYQIHDNLEKYYENVFMLFYQKY